MLTIRTSKCNALIKKPCFFLCGFIIQKAGLPANRKLARNGVLRSRLASIPVFSASAQVKAIFMTLFTLRSETGGFEGSAVLIHLS